MKLILKFDNQGSQEFIFSKKSVSIGRSLKNDITINNGSVSAMHAVINNTDKGFFLDDDNSTNGSYINNVKIKHHPLTDGDIITIGTHQLIFDSETGETDKQSEATVMVSADFQKQLQEELAKIQKPSVSRAKKTIAAASTKNTGFLGKFKNLLGL